MALSRAFFDVGLVAVATLALVAAGLTAVRVRRPFGPARMILGGPLQLGLAALAAGGLAALVTGAPTAAGLWAGLALAGSAALTAALPRLTAPGALQMLLTPLALLASAPWTYLFLRDNGAPRWVLAITLAASALALLLLGFTFAGTLARQAVLTHARWRRPAHPLAPRPAGHKPKVSIHLPAYAEPPGLVIAVLDALAALDYPDFEVIVCDNNTVDPALWRPVEAHCARLNAAGPAHRFRFYHVAQLDGAKAGALNRCLEWMAPDTDLVAVIDADYLAEPDFLARLVGFFDDPAIGYVQTPHDYRAFESSAYLRACYWEYMPSNKVEMPGVNEYGAAYTIGTMCLLRAEALVRAGGWAEWCLTEDSEVSVRLRALGLGGVYLGQTFGRGLIPETFEDYKKQRFRWTAGPVQQLRRHWRLYLPRRLGGSPLIGGWSKLLEAQRGAAPLVQGIATLASVIVAMLGMLLVGGGARGPVIVPSAAWVALGLGLLTALLATWHRYRLSGCRRIGAMLGGELARLSLTYIQVVGGIAGLSRRPLAWRRTPKFRARGSWTRAVRSTLPETALGLVQLALLAVPVALADALGWQLALLAFIGGLLSATRFLAAPAMALLSERHLALRTTP